MTGSTTLTKFDEVSLRELARGVLQPTRPRPDLEVEIEMVRTAGDSYPQIEVVSIPDAFRQTGNEFEHAATMRFVRPDPSSAWFDSPEDVIALVGEPELPAPHPLRTPLIIVAVSTAVAGALLGLAAATGVLAL
jgi:hypothetical protein